MKKVTDLLNSNSDYGENQTPVALFSFMRIQWQVLLPPIKDVLNVSASLV